jgi:hypothetical protein
MGCRPKLLYCDTTNLIVLAEARVRDRQRFDKLLRVWNDSGMTLAFTMNHLLEFRQYADTVARSQRYDLLAELLPIRTEITAPRYNDNILGVTGRS